MAQGNWQHADGDTSTTVVHDVVTAVAEKEGVDPLSLSTPLYSAIDTDALDALFRSPTAGVTVSFEYRTWRVTVNADRTVDVEPTNE